MNRSKNQGFTLIELVVVIVLLGILSATALPKFINLSADAKIATMKSLKGAMQSASTLFHAKYLVSGESTSETNFRMNGLNHRVANGYISHKGTASPQYAAGSVTYALGLSNMIEYSDMDVTIKYEGTTATFALNNNENCAITFTDSVSANTPPVIAELLTGCT